MSNSDSEGGNMFDAETLVTELIEAKVINGTNREKTSYQWWIGDGSRRFLVINDRVELWQDHRPFVNQKIAVMPSTHATAESVAHMIYEGGLGEYGVEV